MNLKLKKVAIATISAGLVAGAFVASAQTAATSCFQFTQNLKLGSTGAQVLQLEKTLNNTGYTISTTGVGSAGMETSYFGAKTKAAVIKYQKANNITPTSGNVYALTRAALNANCTAVGTSTNNGTGSTTVSVSGPVTVALATVQPNTVLVSGSARATLANIVFSGNGTVTNVKFMRSGISNNNTLTNVYLYDTATGARLSDAVSVLTDGSINFSNGYGIFTVTGTRAVSVVADIALANTSGQSIGVSLVGYTTLGNPSAVVSGINGPALPIGSVTLSTVSLTAPSSAGGTITAGSPNVTLWSTTATVSSSNGGNGVSFSGLTLKTIGSAPQNAFANYKLYVDGVQQGNSSSLDTNGRVGFVFTPKLLSTGQHTIEVHADNLSGTGRTIQFMIEAAGDVSFADNNVSAFITPSIVNNTACSAAWTLACAQTAVQSIGSGSLSIQSDPSFNVTRAIGGSSNVTIAQFIARAFGEDEKVYTMTVHPVLSNATTSGNGSVGGLKNVALFLNGGQVGTTQNWDGTNDLTFNLGSQFIVPAGTTSTVVVKADTFSNTSGTALTGGTVTANIVTGVAYGNGINGSNASGATSSYTGTSVTTLTIGSAQGTLSVSGATSKTVSPNTNDVNLGSFSFQTGSSEDITLNQINVAFAVNGDTNNPGTLNGFSNVRLMNGTTQVGAPYGSALGTMSFSANNLPVAKNSAITLSVIANISNVASGASTTVAASAQYRGNVSNVTATYPTSGYSTPVVATINQARFAQPQLSGNNPQSQFIVGGSTPIAAIFSLKTTTGATTINELKFNVGSNSSVVQSLTVGGSTFNVDGSGNVDATGLSIPVTTTAQDLSVTVNTVCFNAAGGNCNTNSLGASNTFAVKLTDIYSNQSTVTAYNSATSTANTMYVVSSKPTIALGTGGSLIYSTKQVIGQVTITPDAAGTIYVNKLGFKSVINVGAVGSTAGTTTLANLYVTTNSDGTYSNIATSSIVAVATSGNGYSFTFANPSAISAATTYYLFADIAGSGSGASVSTSLDASNFSWTEGITGGVAQGAPASGFPISSYYLHN
ncbi:MAG: peptidoglycan-binding domain-containing protein [Candidatus Nomurabacteria bacterium]